mgnify:CR=1 FL=1
MSGPRNHTGHRVGEWHQRAKLTDETVRRMREKYADWKARGEIKGYRLLARIFGCGVSTARDIVTLRTRASA